MTRRTGLVAPFAYTGGKRFVAHEIVRRFGEHKSYVEAFCGGAAVLLAKPPCKNETINDNSGLVTNAWRALKLRMSEVLSHADWPCNEIDLYARSSVLIREAGALVSRLESDPDWCDARLAAWWMWGSNLWIGQGYCVPASDGRSQLCVPRKRRGNLVKNLTESAAALSSRLARVDIVCGDFERVLSPARSGYYDGGVVAVLLDPPYLGSEKFYASSSVQIAERARAWAVAHGDDPRYRIALCGHAGDYEMPRGWTVYEWSRPGGNSGAFGKSSARRDSIWFSPHCVEQAALL